MIMMAQYIHRAGGNPQTKLLNIIIHKNVATNKTCKDFQQHENNPMYFVLQTKSTLKDVTGTANLTKKPT